MDGLAKFYNGKDVLFLEYDVNSPHALHRIDRFMAAWYIEKMPGENAPETPFTMVDSGHEVSWGDRDFRAEYRSMINSELERPAQLRILAVKERPDTTSLVVKAQVTNISTVTLHTPVNGATVHVAVYEGHRALQTGREVHASAQAFFPTPLPPGQSAYFEFPFTRIPGVNLSQVDAAVMVDYVADPILGRYDMMQAAIAGSGTLPPTRTPQPTSAPPRLPTAAPTEPPPAATLAPEPQRYDIFMPAAFRRLFMG